MKMKRNIMAFGLLMAGLLLAGCGEFYEFGNDQTRNARTMHLARRTINLMVGDRYQIPVVFEPDTMSNRSVFWTPENTDIARFEENDVVGVSEGITKVWATSVTDLLTDSVWVNVLPEMYLNPHGYPYDMVIYADVTVHGRHYTQSDEDSLVVAAFIGNELRGIGKMRQWKDKDYMELRIWNDAADAFAVVELRCYHRGKALIEVFPEYLYFDSETHGTLSKPINLVLDENALEYFPWDEIDFEEPVDTIVID